MTAEQDAAGRSGDSVAPPRRATAPPAATRICDATSGPGATRGDDSDRPRDELGRPRNSRPRDGLGRPLPHGAPGVPTTDESIVLSAAQALAEAQRLLDAGRPFHAHEVLEGAWKSAVSPERELWRGLAQLAVGLTHARRGNVTGAARLLNRAADRIAPYAPDPPHGIAVAHLNGWSRALAHRIAAAGVAPLTSAELTPRLTG